MKRTPSFCCALLFLLFALSPTLYSQDLKMTQIQVIGSHNSYKEAMDAPIMMQLGQMNKESAQSLDYAHVSLTEQLQLGLRTLEIDIFYDPKGGRYSHPVGIKDQAAFGITAKPLDTTIMNQAGFKVLHIQDIDFRSNCATLSICLQEILNWSNENPNHLPIAISFNAKEGEIKVRPDFTKPLPFTSTAFDALDAEILSIIPSEKIITPDEVRGNYETLEAAVLANNWPSLNSSKGKLLFILDAGKSQTDIYIEGHPSLKGRIIFPTVPAGQAEAAVIFKNNPVSAKEEIQQLVKSGYFVRTRADAGTKEARTGNYSRFEAAKASGAQLISTDYYQIDERFGTDYKVSFENGKMSRCNPILNECKEADLIEK